MSVVVKNLKGDNTIFPFIQICWGILVLEGVDREFYTRYIINEFKLFTT